jgi:hypothetical protein
MRVFLLVSTVLLLLACCLQDGGLGRLQSHEVSSYREEEVEQHAIPEDVLQEVATQLQELGPDNLQGEHASSSKTSSKTCSRPAAAAAAGLAVTSLQRRHENEFEQHAWQESRAAMCAGSIACM